MHLRRISQLSAGYCHFGWLVSVRAINRSASGFPNALVFCCVRAGPSRAYAPTSAMRKSSVRQSVTLMYRGRIGWTSSKLINNKLAYGLRSKEPQHRQSIPRGTPLKFGWNSGGVAVFSRKPAISLKRGKIGPRLLLMTNRKSHTRFRLVPKSMTLDDLERPFRTLFRNTYVFGAHHEMLSWV